MQDTKKVLSEMAENTLTEIGNIGAGNAITSLSEMLNSKLTMSIPEVAYRDVAILPSLICGDRNESVIVGVLCRVKGDVDSMILLTIDTTKAKELLKMLMPQMPASEEFTELDLSALAEITNIIAGSYLSSLETLTNLKMRHEVPMVSVDYAFAILSVACAEYGIMDEEALLIESKFKIDNNRVSGRIFMFSATESVNLLLEKLGIGGVYEWFGSSRNRWHANYKAS